MADLQKHTNIFDSKEKYLEMVASWKKYYNENRKIEGREPGALQFALYAILRGRDWRKTLAPNTDTCLIQKLEGIFNIRPEYAKYHFGNILEDVFKITFADLYRLREDGAIPRWNA